MSFWPPFLPNATFLLEIRLQSGRERRADHQVEASNTAEMSAEAKGFGNGYECRELSGPAAGRPVSNRTFG